MIKRIVLNYIPYTFISLQFTVKIVQLNYDGNKLPAKAFESN